MSVGVNRGGSPALGGGSPAGLSPIHAALGNME